MKADVKVRKATPGKQEKVIKEFNLDVMGKVYLLGNFATSANASAAKNANAGKAKGTLSRTLSLKKSSGVKVRYKTSRYVVVRFVCFFFLPVHVDRL